MIWLLILAEIILFTAGIYALNKYDEKAGIQVSIKEYVLIGMIFTVLEVILFSFYGYDREFGCHSLILFYLIVAAYIDYKTKKVYRIGSIVFIGFSITLFVLSLGPVMFTTVEKFICIFVFAVIVILQGTAKMMGWGDVLTYIGVFFWLGSWKYECMTVELLAVYMLLANVLFLIFNIRKFDWKNKTMKEEAAFLPGMAGAAIFLEVILNSRF